MTSRSGPGSLEGLRNANRARILDLLRNGEERSQADLARASGLSPGLVSGLVQELVSEGEIVVGVGVVNGRRSNLVALAAERQRYGVGIDLGRTHIRLVIGSSPDRVTHEATRDLVVGHTVDATLDVMGEMLHEGCAAADLRPSQLIGVVVGVPGPVDADRGEVTSSVILPGWGYIPLAERIKGRLSLPTVIENEANLGALALARLHGSRHGLMFVKVGSGVGAGMVLDGRLWRGRTGMAGEVGHVIVDQRLATVCRCGRRGCLETVASTEAVRRAIESAFGRPVSLHEALDLVGSNDAVATAAVSEAGDMLGRGLGLAAAILNPEHIVIGGPLARAGTGLLPATRRGFDAVALPSVAAATELSLCPIGEHAEAIGALLCAMELAVPPYQG